MPQMAPMWWTLLYTMFIACFVMVLIMMYFNIEMQSSMKTNKINMNKTKWTW